MTRDANDFDRPRASPKVTLWDQAKDEDVQPSSGSSYFPSAFIDIRDVKLAL